MDKNYSNKREYVKKEYVKKEYVKKEYVKKEELEPKVEHLNFDTMNIKPDILKGLYLYGFKKPSDIQIRGITNINTGRDCIIQSQSGTGKTATYLLGIINNIDEATGRALIITPTRELAKQVYDVATSICKYSNIKISLCVGGTEITSYHDNIIIGTVGRILHMTTIKKLDITKLTVLVIDEADNMLNENENDNHDLEHIMKIIPVKCQKILISATLTHHVFQFTDRIMTDPAKILLKNINVAVDIISQFYVDVEVEENKFEVLIDLYNLISTTQAIIFCNTISKVMWLAENLGSKNFPITTIHGKMSQTERNDIVQEFRDGKTRLLLTTDLLARGIDVPQVNLVVCYDLPPDKETYIHRIGRCGRFGKKGVSISFIKMTDPYDTKLLGRMKHSYKIDINEIPDNIDTYL
jgi:ATP-dependent RNA helicase